MPEETSSTESTSNFEVTDEMLNEEEWASGNYESAYNKEASLFKGSRYVADKSTSPVRDLNIMGGPLGFNSLADPDNRVFNNTFAMDAPLVMLMPGEPIFIQLSADTIGEGSSAREALNTDEGIVNNVLSALNIGSTADGIINWLSRNNFKGGADLRYYGFRPNYSEYYKYVQNMLSTVHVKMGLGTIFQFADEYGEKVTKNALNYYVNKDISVSEDISNNFGESGIASTMKSASDLVKEVRFILGKNVAASELKTIQDANQDADVTSTVNDILNGGWWSKLTMRGGIDKTKTILNASNLVYPEVWKDSQFTRSISFNVSFFSPYGDPQSIFQYVYGPFISLLALSLPRHDTLMGYSSPFLLKADSPGFFTCDMGVIQSLSYKKGGSEDMYTRQGAPNAIDVSVSIKDLYNVMMMDKSYSLLATNLNMAAYLDNLAGIGITDWNIGKEVSARFASIANNVLGLPDRALNKLSDSEMALKGAIKSAFNNLFL